MAEGAPWQGKGLTVTENGKSFHINVGQAFKSGKYFWSRPSAVGYNAGGSGRNNKGPSNPDYLETVQSRIDTLILKNPDI